jgi:hypothetical protein
MPWSTTLEANMLTVTPLLRFREVSNTSWKVIVVLNPDCLHACTFSAVSNQCLKLISIVIFFCCLEPNRGQFYFSLGAVMAVIVWKLDLQLSMQSMPITTKVVSLNPAHSEVYSIQHYVLKFVSNLRQVGGFIQILLFP